MWTYLCPNDCVEHYQLNNLISFDLSFYQCFNSYKIYFSSWIVLKGMESGGGEHHLFFSKGTQPPVSFVLSIYFFVVK